MVSVGPKHMAAFFIGAESSLYRGYKDEANPDTTWTGWAKQGGVWILDPVVAVRAPYEANIFMVDHKHGLHHSTFNFMAEHGLGPWRTVGGELSSPPAVANRKGTLHIFYIGSDHVLYHKTWDGAKYAPADKYEALGGHSIYSPAAISASADEVSVFAIGLGDGRLHHYHWKSNSGWQRADDDSILGSVLPGLWVGTPSVVSAKEGHWDIFGVNREGKINHLSFADGKLSELEVISGHNLQTIDAISVSAGKIDLIGWGLDAGIYHKTWDSKSWGAWENLGGVILERPSPVSHSPGALAVLVVASDRGMYINVRNPMTKGWGGWHTLKGKIVGRIA